MRKDSGCRESRKTYRSCSTSRFLAQQATIGRLVQHDTFGNSVSGIWQLYTATNETPFLRLMKNLLVHPLESQPACLDLHKIETICSFRRHLRIEVLLGKRRLLVQCIYCPISKAEKTPRNFMLLGLTGSWHVFIGMYITDWKIYMSCNLRRYTRRLYIRCS
ncbi:hypothetical protein BDY19DRAFT_976249 [Irpex rosettiformis]|uniref:Uncharacterized protein n=1 Tax=Irpex rosettiformis TaxID=378272 RepID=A0ACB8TP20_9APHY|nr:hypothetical protein BDY19DRAFT_976249 [Irpex rosettiformis]